MNNNIETFKTNTRKVLLNGTLGASLIFSGASIKGPVKTELKSQEEPIALSENFPNDFVLVDELNTSCRTVLEWACTGWPLECGHTKETEYCPLDAERENLFIDGNLKADDKAFVVNIVEGNRISSSWVVDDPSEVLNDIDNKEIFWKTIHIDYEGQDKE